MIGRRSRPVWLIGPSRFAGIGRLRARIGLVLFGLLLAASLAAAIDLPDPQSGAVPPDDMTTAVAAGRTDLLTYRTIVETVRHGTPFHLAAAEAGRLGATSPTPLAATRLPTLAVVQAAMPIWAARALLLALCVGTVVAWAVRLRPEFSGPVPIAVAVPCLLAGLYASIDPERLVLHEAWTGPLIALSLALRRPGRWQAAVSAALCAMLIRETALLYVVVMTIAALIDGERREAAGWSASILVFGVVLAAHAHAASLAAGPLDPVGPWGIGIGGMGFDAGLAAMSSGLDAVPPWLACVLLSTSLLGWLAWRDPAAGRALATFGGYAVAFSLSARTDEVYPALVATPALLVGIVFAADGLRDLLVAASDRRRITVTRLIHRNETR